MFLFVFLILGFINMAGGSMYILDLALKIRASSYENCFNVGKSARMYCMQSFSYEAHDSKMIWAGYIIMLDLYFMFGAVISFSEEIKGSKLDKKGLDLELNVKEEEEEVKNVNM